ncbi:alpha/beta hydrolase family protein [Alkalimarinus alittae]|uniref:Alpha/beta hydrolase family protein n=1 Tax=Alkalimarinus alittae TaxID=2961619 RepID=A0ABY6N3L8_9ALTE|nr:alpha/beta hydrolase family protein [Alkalimarinus alittae]UZE96674.1 alpha/beta hydrolase family protein [Alkalimarinus alittae]
MSLPLAVSGEENTADEGNNTTGVSDGGDASDEGKIAPLETAKRVHLSPESMKQAALADESVKSQIVWLQSSERSEGESAFLALELYENSAESQGAVILIHGAEQHLNWPNVIKPLRTLLTDDGWYTLSIMLPYKDSASVPARDLQAKVNETVEASDTAPRFSGRYAKFDIAKKEGGEEVGGDAAENVDGENDLNSAETSVDDEAEPTETAADLAAEDSGEDVIDISANEKEVVPTAIPFEEKVQMRLKSALDYVAKKSYQNIVLVGYQQGAQGVLTYLSKNKGFLPEEGVSVIWVDAQLTETQQLDFGKLGGDSFPLKILDVVDSSSRTGVAEGKRRSGQAKRNSYTGYSLVKLPIADMGSMEVSTLTQRIRSWLKVNAPGMQTAVKKTN